MPDGSIRRIFAVQPNAAQMTDSLLAIAIAYSPFLEGTINVPQWIIGLSERTASRDPAVAGMRAYGRGDYRKAVAEWGKELKKEPKSAMLHIPRAYAWVRTHGERLGTDGAGGAAYQPRNVAVSNSAKRSSRSWFR